VKGVETCKGALDKGQHYPCPNHSTYFVD